MNLFDYLEARTDTFDERPLGPVDSVALSQACMVRGEGVVPAARIGRGDVADRLDAWAAGSARLADLARADEREGRACGLASDAVRRGLGLLATSPRFRDLELGDYDTVLDEGAHAQFAALTFVWRSRAGRDNDFAYVGFRGTDGSVTGWRENFDMAVDPPVPAQRRAADYLESVARHLPRHIYVGGHSKGGNLATYAALRAPERVRERIVCVFDHDGPGFKPSFLERLDFSPLEGRIHRTVPEESVVGMLMDTPVRAHVVRSSGRGMGQHDVFTWEVDGDDFSYAEQVAPSATFAHELLDGWLASLGEDETPRVVDALFRAAEASGAHSVGEVLLGGPSSLALVSETARNLDQGSRDVLLPALSKLAAAAARAGAHGMADKVLGL